MSLLKTALGYLAASYVKDVIVRPRQSAQLARAYCTRVGKPLLNVGAGTPRTSLRAALFGSTFWGDVNIDIGGLRGVRPGPRVVTYGNPCDLREYPDRYFGAVIASHVLEHLERPDIALAEWRRVADKVFVVVPPWWAPHAWLHPDHKWFITSDLKTAFPVWTDRQQVYLLPTSDARYGAQPWSNAQKQQGLKTSTMSSPGQSPSSAHSSPVKSQSSLPQQGSQAKAKSDTDSSPSVSVLTVVSSEK